MQKINNSPNKIGTPLFIFKNNDQNKLKVVYFNHNTHINIVHTFATRIRYSTSFWTVVRWITRKIPILRPIVIAFGPTALQLNTQRWNGNS